MTTDDERDAEGFEEWLAERKLPPQVEFQIPLDMARAAWVASAKRQREALLTDGGAAAAAAENGGARDS